MRELRNTTVEFAWIELFEDVIWRSACYLRGSVVVVRGCGVEIGRGKEAGVFELGGYRGIGRGGNVCGRLFGGNGRMGQTGSERECGGGRGGGNRRRENGESQKVSFLWLLKE
ncbi:uncharacterized protein MONOS_10814 [Monocercomonoides exilis]|uniref:uncharacterized protein n=1 Tax=Monocercomonoides exilis TaxID=2049356 RepID=UPI00355986FC|nr:hypothetical protein MONOS_10814 [Monocercomonoides exilis]|eukprot:MONOS_10814.1-p1 / transcript=MONOS_10814.1 / gene=MONOS_10814 / organism=Monocercomonoides_exilis_PA203 / gene_product=unspecified product / transcript_product=unspecified product / location=Mono_scaffold00506:44952-45290(+) / protein_length=113 / sequence_SO=supercontig / SO=protein_coding / is_pseudo=false